MPYYMGDPGFLSVLGKLAGVAASAIPGVGPIVRGVTTIAGGLAGKLAKRPVGIAGPLALPGGAMAQRVLPGLKGALGKIPKGVLVAGGAAAGAAGALGLRAALAGGARRRRMNVCNVRALRRSIRRAEGFSRLARRVLRFTSPRPPRGRAIFKSRKRRARV